MAAEVNKMTKLLLRLFVKDYDDTSSPKVRAAYGWLAGWVGIAVNLLLFVGKLIVGAATASVSITADAVNNLSDASGSIVTLLGFHLAAKPADEEHPYGHDRAEYLAGLAVAALILMIGAELVKSSVKKIIHPAEVGFSAAVVAVLLFSIACKLYLAVFNRTLGKRIQSPALEATAADSRNDVITTAAVLIASIVSRVSGVPVDGWAGLAVAIFILWSGVGIAKDTIDPLLGCAPDEQLVHSIAHEIKSYDKRVLGIHDLMVHDYGPGRRFASVHVEMDAREDVLQAHDLIDRIERDVKARLHVELVIHYDPVVTNDAELNVMRARVEHIIHDIDERLSVHDFRMVRGSTQSNLIFDLVLPPDLEGQELMLKKQIDEKIQFGKRKYDTIITFDMQAFNDPHTR